MRTLRSFLLAGLLLIVPGSADAQDQLPDEPASHCLAVAGVEPQVRLASLTPAALEQYDVSITYVTHSTFRIETSGGIVIVTDYAGPYGDGRAPDVATMNRAHSSHFTSFPDEAITHVLRGWGEDGEPARHRLKVGDVFIRNVTTDIRGGDYGRRPDDNSIFIFEAAGLCIGHLGHLHHELTVEQRTQIGRLDVVFVPVDGTYTMAQQNMANVLKELRASLIIPMHAFGPYTLQRFLATMAEDFPVEFNDTSTITVSLRTLPDVPKVVVLAGF